MSKLIPTLLALSLPLFAAAQDIGFKFGRVTYNEISQKTYAADTSAGAYVISEYGDSSFDPETFDLIFTYHTKIKILRQENVDKANVSIPIYKGKEDQESVSGIQASSFNLEGTVIKETKLESKTVFTEKNEKYYSYVKFAIPNTKAGSIIEYQYELRSPFAFNLHRWEFQDDIPKMESVYRTSIPANYLYNITLRGYLQLSNHDSKIIKECMRVNGGTSDCSVNVYSMKNIPAFKEEEFMTSKKNYLSSINYELSTVKTFDGRTIKYTEEWKDADVKLKGFDNFGAQLRRGKDVVDGYIDVAVLGEKDPLQKAKKIYDFVKYHYIWNGYLGDRSDLGIKKAFDEKKGNVGDINLTLVAALRYAGFNVDPVLISTRANGRPVELHPVLSDFNYVIAKLDLDGKTYLLDAVDDYLPFGSIPLSCYNDIGRVINPEGSYWMNIKPTEKDRIVTLINLKLDDKGTMSGTITESSFGYAAVKKRKTLDEFQDQKAYLENRRTSNHFMNITSYERTKDDDLSKPLVEKFGVEFEAFDPSQASSFLFNPFLAGREQSNPFKADNRAYPIDFAVPLERSTTIMIEMPEGLEVTSIPEKIGVAIPNAGGKYIFGVQAAGNKLTVINNLGITRTAFAPEEYPYLKEIYTRMLQAQNIDIIFQKKKQ